jgi:hypothetical protein
MSFPIRNCLLDGNGVASLVLMLAYGSGCVRARANWGCLVLELDYRSRLELHLDGLGLHRPIRHSPSEVRATSQAMPGRTALRPTYDHNSNSAELDSSAVREMAFPQP